MKMNHPQPTQASLLMDGDLKSHVFELTRNFKPQPKNEDYATVYEILEGLLFKLFEKSVASADVSSSIGVALYPREGGDVTYKVTDVAANTVSGTPCIKVRVGSRGTWNEFEFPIESIGEGDERVLFVDRLKLRDVMQFIGSTVKPMKTAAQIADGLLNQFAGILKYYSDRNPGLRLMEVCGRGQGGKKYAVRFDFLVACLKLVTQGKIPRNPRQSAKKGKAKAKKPSAKPSVVDAAIPTPSANKKRKGGHDTDKKQLHKRQKVGECCQSNDGGECTIPTLPGSEPEAVDDFLDTASFDFDDLLNASFLLGDIDSHSVAGSMDDVLDSSPLLIPAPVVEGEEIKNVLFEYASREYVTFNCESCHRAIDSLQSFTVLSCRHVVHHQCLQYNNYTCPRCVLDTLL